MLSSGAGTKAASNTPTESAPASTFSMFSASPAACCSDRRRRRSASSSALAAATTAGDAAYTMRPLAPRTADTPSPSTASVPPAISDGETLARARRVRPIATATVTALPAEAAAQATSFCERGAVASSADRR
jgi:hypothetical protein